ncbi:hypothetical protein BJY04DRAFT_190151 [Aspergillus karnatakaensis]|uniref:uncharacterized protein n=1 Tax=Aspergillus karnatakaensis TaxID=1810916 RepID=UPI003CCD86E8
MHNDDDVQEAKAILDAFADHDKARAIENAHDSDSFHSPYSPHAVPNLCSPGVRICNEVARDYGTADRVKGPNSYFEWGVDEPEFEGNPAFSDDEKYGFGEG